jgi:quercetin dioxygenase-like cupin family protein
MGRFAELNGIAPIKIWEGAVARAVQGERLTLAVVDLEPDQAVPEHHHDNEQLGFVLKGSITMVVGGESRTLRPGEAYAIPSQVPHSAHSGPEGASVVDVFCPVRSDWASLPRLEPSVGAWPG